MQLLPGRVRVHRCRALVRRRRSLPTKGTRRRGISAQVHRQRRSPRGRQRASGSGNNEQRRRRQLPQQRRRPQRRKKGRRARRKAQEGPSPWVHGPRAAEDTGLVPDWLLLLPVASMAEDWLDCPALGPGWKRREVFRKSGATCGRSDTYYQSPTGDRIRSKVELTRYLGPACDLSLFDFKQGILCYPAPKAHSVAVTSKKQKKPSRPSKTRKHQAGPQGGEVRKRQVGPQSGEVRKEAPKDETKADTVTVPASFPAPGCCENCGISFSGDGTQRQRLKTLCKDCRAQRIAFNREQRMFKRVGCGECAACQVTEDCGACSTCLLQLPHDVASGLFCKCERRRCLRIVERSRGCGVCRGCQTQEDCGRCRICLRPPRPGLRRQWKCVQRRCLRHLAHRLRRRHQRCQRRTPLTVAPPTGKHGRRRGGCDSKMAARRRPSAQPLPPPPPSQPPEPTEPHPRALAPSPPAEFIYYCVDEDELPYTNRRQNRKCGACAACLRRMDCGRCDFCCDKPKFGGSNQKRQKCRWRQCLQFAMKRLLPSVWSESEDGAGSPPPYRRRKRPSSAQRHHLGPTLKPTLDTRTAQQDHTRASSKQEAGGGFVLPPPGTDLVFLREGASSPVQVPGPVAASTEARLQEAQCSGLSWVVALPQVKQEKADTQDEWTPGTAVLTSPVLVPGCPSKAVDQGLPSVKQEPPDPEEDKEENKDDSASKLAPEEEAGGAGTPVITEIFSLGGTRFRDTAVWLPSLQGRHSGREDGCKMWETEDTVEPTSTSWNRRGWPRNHVSLSPPPASMTWVSCRRSWCPSSQS
ncbi:methyl-CpG-binding domain protein 1 isoform X2 [Cebus imitator]|uniref:methyl-CpG-binding domain protein 1 isoform X2 n=1 Tax=Cebus imitator TaxID=2715852 RepID=UPI00080A057D|nr:methyl-CpG-binding domain protein 1 isoform X2 [Cebus imitator]